MATLAHVYRWLKIAYIYLKGRMIYNLFPKTRIQFDEQIKLVLTAFKL